MHIYWFSLYPHIYIIYIAYIKMIVSILSLTTNVSLYANLHYPCKLFMNRICAYFYQLCARILTECLAHGRHFY